MQNKYDYILTFFIALLACGGIGAGLQPIRILMIVLLPFMIVYFIRHPQLRLKYRYEILFFIVWWIYICFTLLLAVDFSRSEKDVLYFTLHFCGFFELLWLAQLAADPQRSIIKGWLWLFALTVPIALYELWFDVHLPMSVQESGAYMNYGYEVLERRFASVTFGNLNSYNTTMCYVLPFLVLWLLKENNRKNRWIAWLLCALLYYIIISNSSRGAILCLGFASMLFVWFYMRKGKTIVLLLLGFICIGYIAANYLSSMFTLITERFAAQGLEDEGRMENISKGLMALWDSNLLGIGVGNYAPIMENVYHVNIPAPHNLFLEVLVLFGVFIFVGFLGLFVRIYKCSKSGQRYNREMMLSGLLLIVPIGVINSGYIVDARIWIYLASLYVCVDKSYNVA